MTPPAPDSVEVGRRIRAARRLAHLSQAELARRVGIRAAPMNNIEQGRSLPSTPVVAAIALELGVTVDALLWGGARDAGAGPGAPGLVREGGAPYGGAEDAIGGMRVMRPEALRGRPELCARLDAVAAAYLALEDVCGAMKAAQLPLAIPHECSTPGLTALVARVRALLGVGEAVIFDYLELLENAGLRVVFLDLPGDLESIGCHDARNANVMLFIHAHMNAERHLFRLLFELGWIYGHVRESSRSGAPAAAFDPPLLDAAHAARKFAALFLMPEPAVRATVRQLGMRPHEWTYPLLLRIKHRFGVSAQAFNLRLLELDLITPLLQSELRARIEAHYAATNYGEPDSTRRLLSPNGRLGDLLLCAREHRGSEETAELAATLQGLPGVGEGRAGEEP